MPNPYVNKVVQSNGTTLIDISDTTAVASDVAEGKYFYLASGEKVVGTDSGGSSSWETVYSGTVDVINAESGIYYGWINPWTEPIEQNSVWKVTWNGVTYECTATWEGSSDGNPYAIGNYTFDGGQGGNNEPFMLQPYYGTQLIVLSETSGSYAITIQKQVSGSSGYTRTVIVPEQTVTPTNADGKTKALLSTPTGTLVEGDNYIITFDGEEFWFTCIDVGWGGFSFIGCEDFLWGTGSDHNYPCLIIDGYSDDNNLELDVYDGYDGTPITIKVEKIELS